MRKMLCIFLAAVVLCALMPLLTTDAQAAEVSAYPPYAQIEYNYTPQVQCGTIRYISQIVNGSEYRYDYWKEWEKKRISGVYYGPESECGTSCISMALSYVGVNKTPKDILDYGRGRTHFQDWGNATISNLSVSNFKKAMENYINGDGCYSPPVIHLPGYSDAGHFVVVVGKIDEQTYEILDPNNLAVTRMTINGSTAKFTLRGNSKTSRIDRLHQWYNPNAVPSAIKKVYPASCVVKATGAVQGMSHPATTQMYEKSKAVLTLEEGQQLNAVEVVLNSADEYWYKVQSSDNTTFYVPANKVQYQQENQPNISISGANNPTNLAKGSGFGIKGKITSDNSPLTAVSACVRRGNGAEGEVVTSGKATPNGKTFNLAGSSVNSAVRFGKLAEGEYTYLVEAQYINYYISAENTLASNSKTVVLHQAGFTVTDMTDRNPPEQPTLQVDAAGLEVQFSWDSAAHATHYLLSIQKKNEAGEWEQQESINEASSGITRTLLPGEYCFRLSAYNKNAGNAQSNADDVVMQVECAHTYGEGVTLLEATCKQAGFINYECMLCGKIKKEAVAPLTAHTPGPEATPTTDQTCTICGDVLKEATGETEPTEPTEPEQEVSEPTENNFKTVGNVFGITVAAALAGVAVFLLWKKEQIMKKPQEAEEIKETQS